MRYAVEVLKRGVEITLLRQQLQQCGRSCEQLNRQLFEHKNILDEEHQ